MIDGELRASRPIARWRERSERPQIQCMIFMPADTFSINACFDR